jgi:hypothetical protein
MTNGKDDNAKTKKKVQTDEFWYDPMNYPAFLKKHDDTTPLV